MVRYDARLAIIHDRVVIEDTEGFDALLSANEAFLRRFYVPLFDSYLFQDGPCLIGSLNDFSNSKVLHQSQLLRFV